MPLTPEQNATLQLVLERGQSYADLARVLGVEEPEVRARARAALAELGGADPDRHVALTDFLLGQADPIARADAVRHLRDDAGDYQLASGLSASLRAAYPNAELPRLPGEPRPQRRPRRELAGAARHRLSGRQTRLVAILASAAILLIAVILGVAGVFGGDDGGSPADTETEAQAPADERAVPVVLEPVGGSDARGAVVFGFATADQPYIEFQIRDLQQPNPDDAYVLWFLLPDGQGFPVPVPLEVDNQGRIFDRIAVPAETIAVALEAESIAIALDNRRRLDADINEAIRGDRQVLEFRGETVLRADLRRNAGSGGEGSG